MKRASGLLIGHSSFLSIWPDPLTRIFKVQLSSSLRSIFTASMHQEGPIDPFAKLIKECGGSFTMLENKKNEPFAAFIEVQSVVKTQFSFWPVMQKRIKGWQDRQLLGSSGPKVNDALKTLELLAPTLDKGESLPLQKSSVYRSADLSKIVVNELLKLKSHEFTKQETIEESQKLRDTIYHLLKLFPSSDSEENNLPNEPQPPLIEWPQSPNQLGTSTCSILSRRPTLQRLIRHLDLLGKLSLHPISQHS